VTVARRVYSFYAEQKRRSRGPADSYEDRSNYDRCITRVNANTLHYEFTVDDPVVYSKAWTVALDLATTPDYQIYEYACHEGNYGLANILSAARAEKK
jgi:hypothetical protein